MPMIKAVMYCGGKDESDPASMWRISWVPGQSKFEIESLDIPRHTIVRWGDWSVVYNDEVGEDHAKAYEFAEVLFARCVAGEIPYEG